MSFGQPIPPTKLGRYRPLAPRAGVHISPIILGGMSIGDKWAKLGMGSMDKESSFKLLDAYYDAGGNAIDTANVYQDGSSEECIGEWMEKRKNRDQIFIMTKYTNNLKLSSEPDSEYVQKVQYTGNNIKSLHLSVEKSLERLRTNYIDLLYVHWWDYVTSVEEVMDGLHNLVVQGKVLYLGISDTPAHIVADANNYAKYNGKTPFVVYQGMWSLVNRDFEREMLPMARRHGMAIAPWGVLAGGKLRSDEEEERRRQTGEGGRTLFLSKDWERSENERKVSNALEKVAKDVGAKNVTSVAIAYIMQKAPYIFPIIGGRKVEQLLGNLEALDIALTPEHIEFLESVVPFDFGFPYSHFGRPDGDYNDLFKTAGVLDKWPVQQAIRPTK
ncbi:aryl-alcohol dehydrogenase [NADP(+)] [Cristinia sonorae]|uniref:Aryl-alcohol dehydrogenase [NADP(+)] n=1 Tax=Cristinia sonorae TaxID=1940300 RepID=A0A8K0URD7_9AGAR|nr:aryl-alcohol dehydrogenase [NADP(+)] [Cristinia sonorae]